MLVRNTKVVETIPQVVEIILTLSESKKVVVVLLAAPTHSGKTFTSMKLEEGLAYYGTQATTVRHDWWNMGINRTPKDVTVSISEDIDAIGFEKAIHELLFRGVIRPPVYDPRRMWHVKTKGDPLFFKEGVLILDGAFVFLRDGLREISSLNIYVDVPWDLRRNWLEQCHRDFKGLNPNEVKVKLEADQERTALVARASAGYADVILRPDPSTLPVNVICDHATVREMRLQVDK